MWSGPGKLAVAVRLSQHGGHGHCARSLSFLQEYFREDLTNFPGSARHVVDVHLI